MNKREMYENIVSEVEADTSHISTSNSYIEAVTEGAISLSLPKGGVLLKTPTSAFADYAVRDSVLIKAMEKEEFAFVLINKIGNTVQLHDENNKVTQDDLEAVVTAGQVAVMWEQFGVAHTLVEMANDYASKYVMEMPTLNTITKHMLDKRSTFPFEKCRKETIADLSSKAQQGLDNE